MPGWPTRVGNDFVANHLPHSVDYGSIHFWPDNWGRTDLAWGESWIDSHVAFAAALGKPLVLEEFGKFVGVRLIHPLSLNLAGQHWASSSLICCMEKLTGRLRMHQVKHQAYRSRRRD